MMTNYYQIKLFKVANMSYIISLKYSILVFWLDIVSSKLDCTYNDPTFGVNKSSNEHYFEFTQSYNLARQEYIQQMCNHITPKDDDFRNLSKDQLKHLLVDHKHKLLYCYVPKVACTNWKRIFLILQDKWNGTDVLNIPATLAHTSGIFPKLSNISLDDRVVILETYHKLILVRHPFERLLSAYRNKLEGKSQSAQYFQNRVAKKIIKAFRENPSEESLMKGHDVSFEEFARFLTTTSDQFDEFKSNEHWQAITKLCNPCAVKYTLVGKYETILDDSMLALHTINASQITFPQSVRTSGTADKLKKYYSPLPLPLIRKLYKLYEDDFKIFNYNLEDILGFDLA